MCSKKPLSNHHAQDDDVFMIIEQHHSLQVHRVVLISWSSLIDHHTLLISILLCRFIVLYSYHAQDENDLSVERGQCVTVLNKVTIYLADLIIMMLTFHSVSLSWILLNIIKGQLLFRLLWCWHFLSHQNALRMIIVVVLAWWFICQIYVDFSGLQDDPGCTQNEYRDSCWF